MRLAYLDHACGGRLNVAFTQGTSVTDWRSFRPDVKEELQKGQIMTEGIDLILKYWTEPGPWQYEGEWFKAENVGPHPPEGPSARHHLYPLQQPHPPIALAGITREVVLADGLRQARLDPDVARPEPADHLQALGTRGGGSSGDRAHARTAATGAW